MCAWSRGKASRVVRSEIGEIKKREEVRQSIRGLGTSRKPAPTCPNPQKTMRNTNAKDNRGFAENSKVSMSNPKEGTRLRKLTSLNQFRNELHDWTAMANLMLCIAGLKSMNPS